MIRVPTEKQLHMVVVNAVAITKLFRAWHLLLLALGHFRLTSLMRSTGLQCWIIVSRQLRRTVSSNVSRTRRTLRFFIGLPRASFERVENFLQTILPILRFDIPIQKYLYGVPEPCNKFLRGRPPAPP